MADYFLLGDSCFIVRFGTEINKEINRKVQIFASLIEKEKIKGVKELVPAYSELAVYYDSDETEYNHLIRSLKILEEQIKPGQLASYTIVHIPVCYGGKYGSDLNYVAEYNKLTKEEVIRIHSEPLYLVYMLGFTPGFCYLGGLDPRLATPRKANPDANIKAGVVGIAGEQTGIYPIDSPGGWQVIGRTPVKIFNPLRKESVLVEAGNYIRFVPVDKDEYKQIQEEVDKRKYKIKKTKKRV
jgi:inhibitor of KinA